MGKQFIERNQVVIGVVTAVLIAAALYASLAITRDDLTGGYRITAEFADAGGLRPGDRAMVAGIPAGRVVEIDIVGDRVEAVLQIDGGVELPTTTRAEITLRTIVGKRAVALETGTDFTQLLDEGDRIPLERTSVTIDVPELAESANDVLGGIDSEALNLLILEVSEITRDQREEVADLIGTGTDLTELVNSQEVQIRELLRNLSRVSSTLQSRDDELIGIIDDLDVALGALAARRADLQALLRETQTTGAVTADFVRDVREDLDAILDELALDLEIVSRHQVDLAEGLAYAGDSLVGFSSIAYAQGQPVPWGHVFVTAAGPVGVDLIAGCGGLLDRTLDSLLGPDPRSCAEQVGDTFPPDVEPGAGPLLPGVPDIPVPELPLVGDLLAAPALPPGDVVVRAPQRLPIDLGPRSLLEAISGGAEDGS